MIAIFGKIKCAMCGEKNDKENKYCLRCGSQISVIKCSACNTDIDAHFKYCPGCGADAGQLANTAEVWRRDAKAFAYRFEVSDLKGVFRKKVTVEQGTKAIFLQDGKFSGELPPGTYSFGGLIEKITTLNLSGKATIILVDDSDVRLDFNIDGLRTSENFDAGVKGTIVISVEEPVLLFNNLIKSRERTSIKNIEEMLRDEMRNLFQSRIKEHGFEDLYGNLQLKQAIEQDFEHLLHTTLTRMGLKLIHMPYFDYDESYWKEIIRAQGESAKALIRQREEIRQAADKQLIEYEESIRAAGREVELGKDKQVIEEDREMLAVKRSELDKKIRERLTADKIDEFQSAEELEKFVHELDKDKVMRENEMAELKQIFEENHEDRAIARKLMLEKLVLTSTLDKDTAVREHERAQSTEDAAAKIKIEEMQNRADAEEAEILIELLEKKNAAKREDEFARAQKEADIEAQQLKMRSTASDEALISMTDGKQAEHLSELARMKLATGLTDEQILALGAKDSAAIAEAFKEKYTSKSADEIMAIYEDRLGDRDAMLKTIQEMADKGSDRLERLAAKALEQMGTTAATRAQDGAPGSTTVVTGGGLQPVVVGGGAPTTPPAQETTKVIICRECDAELLLGTKFCTSCGAAIGTKES